MVSLAPVMGYETMVRVDFKAQCLMGVSCTRHACWTAFIALAIITLSRTGSISLSEMRKCEGFNIMVISHFGGFGEAD